MRKYEYSKDLVNIVKQFLVDDEGSSDEIRVNPFDVKKEGGVA